ncbi:hypothetical protein C8R42DRAFT_708916 [Lentinula raphanica]|nr:hypothetical protein C8R42DRAFT_708916 [Lentinula raphanica]
MRINLSTVLLATFLVAVSATPIESTSGIPRPQGLGGSAASASPADHLPSERCPSSANAPELRRKLTDLQKKKTDLNEKLQNGEVQGWLRRVKGKASQGMAKQKEKYKAMRGKTSLWKDNHLKEDLDNLRTIFGNLKASGTSEHSTSNTFFIDNSNSDVDSSPCPDLENVQNAIDQSEVVVGELNDLLTSIASSMGDVGGSVVDFLGQAPDVLEQVITGLFSILDSI